MTTNFSEAQLGVLNKICPFPEIIARLAKKDVGFEVARDAISISNIGAAIALRESVPQEIRTEILTDLSITLSDKREFANTRFNQLWQSAGIIDSNGELTEVAKRGGIEALSLLNAPIVTVVRG